MRDVQQERMMAAVGMAFGLGMGDSYDWAKGSVLKAIRG